MMTSQKSRDIFSPLFVVSLSINDLLQQDYNSDLCRKSYSILFLWLFNYERKKRLLIGKKPTNKSNAPFFFSLSFLSHLEINFFIVFAIIRHLRRQTKILLLVTRVIIPLCVAILHLDSLCKCSYTVLVNLRPFLVTPLSFFA